MAHVRFWEDTLFATRLLYFHSKELFVKKYVEKIVRFAEEKMVWNLNIVSWNYPFTYVMNSESDPLQDIERLSEFVRIHVLTSCDYHHLIVGYIEYIEFLLTIHLRKLSCNGC